MRDPDRYGLLAAFDSPEALVVAASHVRERGFTALDAFTPYPVKGLPEAVGVPKDQLRLWAFIGGAIGGLGIVGLQVFSTTVAYPIDVGGRPLAAFTAFLVPGFECIILGASLTAFFGMLAGNRLPTFYHPVFNAHSYSMARGDRFYLLIGGDDPRFDRQELSGTLTQLKALSIEDVPK